MLKGVIFDFDGVLVDSEKAHFEGMRLALLENAGIDITFHEYTEHYLAYDDHGGMRRALERYEKDTHPNVVDGLATRKKTLFEELLPKIAFLPGAADLIVVLHEARVPLAIASGARRVEIETLLQAANLLDRFNGIVSADDVVSFKPHPEPYLRARAFVGALDSPEGIVVFEDSAPGIAAARAADLRVIAITNSMPRAKLGLAHGIIDSLTEMSLPALEAFAGGH